MKKAAGSKIIAVVGPTASGKSALAIALAKKFGGEIISADSRQVYRGLDIGTGKVTKKEMGGIPHHILDVASPKRQLTVDDFVRLGTKAYSSILQNTRIAIVVGGTGLYIDMLLGRMSYPAVPPNKKLRELLERQTTEKLFAQLKKLDPRRAKTIEPHNKRRLIRAIEIAQVLRSKKNPEGGSAARPARGLSKFSAENLRTPEGLLFAQQNILWLGLNPKNLKKRIRIRLFARIRAGMVAEAKHLHKKGLSYKRMEELGLEYRYLARLLQGKITKQEFLEQLEREINRYAKRQMRWFRRNKNIHWIENKSESFRLAKEFFSR